MMRWDRWILGFLAVYLVCGLLILQMPSGVAAPEQLRPGQAIVQATGGKLNLDGWVTTPTTQPTTPPLPFVSDGCSAPWFLRKLFDRPAFQPACLAHDRIYHRGGTQTDRLVADLELAIAIARLGYPIEAELMLAAVRTGGGPCRAHDPPSRRSYCWAYGWPSDPGYTDAK